MSVDTRVPGLAADGARQPPLAVRRIRRRRGGWVGKLVPPLITFGIFVGIWYFVSQVLLDPDRRFLLPTPVAVLRIAFLDPYNRTDILQALWLSTVISVIGFVIAVVLGMALGIAMSQGRWVERSLYPYAVILQCIPTLALVPVIGF